MRMIIKEDIIMEDLSRKVRMNHSSHLLELEEYMYPLVDVDQPNTFRNLIPTMKFRRSR